MEDDGKKHSVQETVLRIVDSAGGLDALKPSASQLTDYVEWVVAHKGCGKPLTGMSPKNGHCKCLVETGMPPGVKQIMGWCLEDCEAYAAGYKAALSEKKEVPTADAQALVARCEAAEKEVAKLTEKLDKSSKKISELMKERKGGPTDEALPH